jgi:hypothetical protein
MIGDRYLMRIPTEIFDNMLGTSKGTLSIHYPRRVEQGIIKRWFQSFELATQCGYKSSSENLAHGFDREQKFSVAAGRLPLPRCRFTPPPGTVQ